MRAVTLVTHGLNMRPAGMLSLVEWLCAQGSAVILVGLAGHVEEGPGFGELGRGDWERDMKEGYEMAKGMAEGRLLYFLGYSLGALLGEAMSRLGGDGFRFDRKLWLAPATAIRPRSYFLKWMYAISDRVRLPSMAPRRFRVRAWLPVGVYRIMFELESSLGGLSAGSGGAPVLVLIDPRDELISLSKLRKAAMQRTDGNVRIVTLNSAMRGRYGGYHHLIIDESTMGAANWGLACREMRAFLFE